MITKDINGNTLGADFITALTASDREYDARLLDDGTELDCSVDKITITKGSCGSADGFTIGSIVGSTLTADVRGLSTAVKGKEIEAQVGLKVNGSFVYLTLGYFTVSEAKQNVYATTITAYGASITKSGGAFTAPQVQQLGNVASAISSSMSALAGRTISVSLDSGITASDVITEPMNGLTAYQALEILATVCGGYVIDTYDGNLKVCRFSDTPTLSRNNDTMLNLPVVEEEDFGVTGVVVTVKDGYEKEEEIPDPEDPEETITVEVYVPPVTLPATPTGNENLFIKNQYVTQELYTANIATLANYEYRPATIGLTYGDPRLEGNDVVSVTDINSEVYVVPCHMLTHTYTGGFSTQISSVNATPQADEVASSAGSLTETLSNINASAMGARTSAESAKTYAQNAKQSAEEAEYLAQQAHDLAEGVYDLAQQASEDAQSASESAETARVQAMSASSSANTALDQLSVVEDIVGVLDLITKNGDYQRSLDTQAVPDKWYFIRAGSGTSADPYTYTVQPSPTFEYVLTSDVSIVTGKPYYTRTGTGTSEDPYQYALVENPVVADIGTYYENTGWNYFELVGIDSSIQNYVSSHLVLDEQGLNLKNGNTRVLLSPTEGLKLYDSNGYQVAQYGTDAVVGNPFGFHITITPDYNNTGEPRLSFYTDQTTEVAYISGQRLYITQSVVLQQMDVGTPIADGGLGQWSWKVHTVDNANNLYLKWLG